MNQDFSSYLLWEQDGVIVVNKPAGLASTGRTLDDPKCVQFDVMQHYRRKVWAVHQLDTDTSGLLIFVRQKRLVSQWQERLSSSTTLKRYIAVAHGCLPHPEVEVHAPLAMQGRVPNRKMVVSKSGKPAHSSMRQVATNSRASLLSIDIHTGRTHQIRAHLEHLGLSLFGEKRYRTVACKEHPRHALHASEIVFGDNQQPAHFRAPLPQDIKALMTRLDLEASDT